MSFKEQLMSKDRCPSIPVKLNGNYCVYYPSSIVHNTWHLLKLREHHSDSPQPFSQVTRLDQSRVDDDFESDISSSF